MNRRDCLVLSGSAFAASLSGCLSSVPLVSGPPEVSEESEPPERGVPTVNPGLSANSTVATLAVGRGSNHHQVWIWNETDRSRAVAVGIGGGDDAEPWYRSSYDLDADANLAIDLRESRRYAITVRVGERAKTVAVPESRFDCNDSATDVAIRKTEITTGSISTSMDCGGFL